MGFCANVGLVVVGGDVSPTQRSLALLRKQGWHCEVVEHWNPWSKTRKDLWGWCDILCLDEKTGEVMAVQTTTKANVNARTKKIRGSDTLKLVRACGISVRVHGWHKIGNKWECKLVAIT